MARILNLNETLDNYENIGDYENVPDYIAGNLAFDLREYQAKALQRYLYYSSGKCNLKSDGVPQKKSPHLLWQMATGSGKTLVMAALVLEMYKNGYRNFWYFVSSTDIVTKTIDNFANPSSKKYQFASKIEIDGRRVEIAQVENFTGVNGDDINIKFSTINELHNIVNPELAKENQIALQDFENTPLVLIADEAHHLNASAKKEEKDEKSWENSVQDLLKINPQNRLFEFTATAGFSNAEISQKYQDKLIFNYDLKKFCSEKYSKDVFTFATDTENVEQIELRAVLISEYRKHIASDSDIFLKPVILFKSKSVNDSKDNFTAFNEFIKNLSARKIKEEFKKAAGEDENDIWSKTKKYFSQKESALAEEIKDDFDAQKKKVLLHDGTNKRPAEQPHLLATLEDSDNPVRAIFVVNMLQEGWDVLNLFDIARLYDTRDGNWSGGKYKAGATTISEQQLIGRGARYFPFRFQNEDKYKRKFDNNLSHPLRAIETLHYHCAQNPEYISELHKALIESGVMQEDANKKTYAVKQKKKFINDAKFQSKRVYENKKIPQSEILLFTEDELVECAKSQGEANCDNDDGDVLEIALASGVAAESNAIEDDDEKSKSAGIKKMTQLKIAELLPKNILRRALDSDKNFTFEKLKEAYPEMKSVDDYIKTLSRKTISVALPNDLSCGALLEIAKKFLNSEKAAVQKEARKEYVVKKFESFPASEKFPKEITWKANDADAGKYKELKPSIENASWLVYEKNYGTGDENSFIEWFSEMMTKTDAKGKTELEKNGWSDIFLARNEEKSANPVKLYSWLEGSVGAGFEPDFVLFMTKKKIDYVFYIEAKGDWTYDKQDDNFGGEQWKEDFLLEIENVAGAQTAKESESEKFHIIGLPFYNAGEKDNGAQKNKFTAAFGEKTK